ncbi:MAG: DUF99 family protein [Candidatus Aenigmatarchaeota archaeon]
MKKFIRTIGIDDAYSENSNFALIVGTMVRGNNLIESVATEKIEIDGLDATEKIISLINKFPKEQIKAIFLSGITFAGFNIANIEEIYEKIKIPIIVLISKFPNFEKIEKALKENFKDWEKRIEFIKLAGKVYKIDNVYCQLKGISLEDAKKIIELTRRNKFPESLRVSHLIASAIATGKSKKKI